MRSFATRNDTEFNDGIAALAGLIVPQLGREHFSLSALSPPNAETRAAPEGHSPGPANSGAAPAYNLDACFTMVAALDLPDRIAGIAR